MARHSFYVGDYVVFGLTIVVSLGIGIFYALSGGRQGTTSEYLVAGRSMNFLPVAISLLVSFESSIMMLGMPAEGYVYGIQIVMQTAGYLISQLLSVHIMVPLIHPLKVTSAYEYLEYRFQSRTVRLIGTLLGMLTYTWYMGIVLFGPAVALEAVTGFPQWSSIFVVAAVAVIYTSIGGIKAVIWTDVFQASIMLAGMLAILIKGTMDVGGVAEVWNMAYEGGRLNFFNFSTDLRTRHTFWNLFVGSFIRGFGMVFNQATIQRISSTKTMKQAMWVIMLVAPAFLITMSMATYEGIVAYTYYQTRGCDPIKNKEITNSNQIIPYMVMDIFQGLPGMPGLFMAALFAASLSTLSSGLSSLSAMLWADIVHPVVGNISEFKATLIAKISVLFFGGGACGVAVLVSLMSGPLTQITGTLLSAFGGPLTGMFFLGCFFPRTTAKGAIIGAFIGFCITSWISLGISFSGAKHASDRLPSASTDMCPVSNVTTSVISSFINATEATTMAANTTAAATTAATAMPEPQGVEVLYTLSYQWLGIVGLVFTIYPALIVSILTGQNKPGDVDPRYLVALSDILLLWCPKSIKNFVSSIGPQFIKEEYKKKFPDPAKQQSVGDTEIEVKAVLTDDLDMEATDELYKQEVTSEQRYDSVDVVISPEAEERKAV